jgi:hypothetical protein
MILNMNINIFTLINQFINASVDKKTVVAVYFRRMRNIHTPGNNLLPKPVITCFREESCNGLIFIKNVFIM